MDSCLRRNDKVDNYFAGCIYMHLVIPAQARIYISHRNGKIDSTLWGCFARPFVSLRIRPSMTREAINKSFNRPMVYPTTTRLRPSRYCWDKAMIWGEVICVIVSYNCS